MGGTDTALWTTAAQQTWYERSHIDMGGLPRRGVEVLRCASAL
jgi:hypothetical protein